MIFLNSLVSRIKAFNLRRIERYRLRKKPIKTPEGFLYKGPSTQKSENWERFEREFLIKIFANYELFLNVGAHYGYYCCMARQAGLKIIAFEPLVVNFKMLLDNLKVNNFEENCTLINAAAGKKPTISQISGVFSTATMLKNTGNDESLSQTIPVVPIDAVTQGSNKKTLVLMDVEGFEHEALLGAQSLLSQSEVTDWIIEIFSSWTPKNGIPEKNIDYFKTFELMFASGYQVWLIGETFRKIEAEELALLEREHFSKRFAGNFYFSRSNLAVLNLSNRTLEQGVI